MQVDMVGTATALRRPASQGKAAPAKPGAPGLLSGPFVFSSVTANWFGTRSGAHARARARERAMGTIITSNPRGDGLYIPSLVVFGVGLMFIFLAVGENT
jgi:hypothetical protein